ncbi:MAG: DNA polymerase III subunit epsilon [Candidatus Muproteobacteria bacterium RBG_16_60_9]|uniref:DNA polymerase III subunit epsilon n=1 Tax=Candidatus Muproteobacteria bacterium RBG_16_60_9 TaxID=1817755 RepID=A0A1F6V0W0_9PROT|nr:MAG: DNA polymerase III subunit epsilon [Candidatus Muproteobacteria bacterium RBG_16_60_9]
MRQIVLDTETTGLEPSAGHRIIEIGCVELVNRRFTGNTYHQYIKPDREIDAAAIEIHGITNEALADKPVFADVAKDFLEFVRGAELIIHNAAFDVGFINHELARVADETQSVFPDARDARIEQLCAVIDSLTLARSLHPGQKNDLNSLCRRYSVDNSQRSFHGALLDAEILADVYLAMTGGQTTLFEDPHASNAGAGLESELRRIHDKPPLPIIVATEAERAAHLAWIEEIDKSSGGRCVWKRLDAVV